MKLLQLAIAFALTSLIGSVPAQADQETTQSVRCESDPGVRRDCAVRGEIQNAGVANQFGQAPCIFGYTWGFADQGLWTARGCRAEFQVVSIVEEQTVDPVKLEARVDRLRKRVRKLRTDLETEREAKRELEKLQQKPANVGAMATAIQACLRGARRKARSAGNDAAARELTSVRPDGRGVWAVSGIAKARGSDGVGSRFICRASNEGEVLEVKYPL